MFESGKYKPNYICIDQQGQLCQDQSFGRKGFCKISNNKFVNFIGQQPKIFTTKISGIEYNFYCNEREAFRSPKNIVIPSLNGKVYVVKNSSSLNERKRNDEIPKEKEDIIENPYILYNHILEKLGKKNVSNQNNWTTV